jgi:hypothetical protein
MTLAVALFGLFVVSLGIAGVLSPQRFLARITRVLSGLGLYYIAGFRLLLGAALLLAAPTARAPLYLQILGGVALLSGILTPFFGVRRFEALLAWWRGRATWIIRLWCFLVLLFGLSMVWAVFPNLGGA